MLWLSETNEAITMPELEHFVLQAAEEAKKRICPHPKRVLLLPPDFTRYYSGAGRLTEVLYHYFAQTADVYLIPALGQHQAHSPEINTQMFGSIPENKILKHDWKNGCLKLGEVDKDVVYKMTHGKADWPIPVWLNKNIIEENWDLIINIGLVVPHEVLGFSNHNKNYFVGLGGKETIGKSHLASALYGIENNLGRLISPVRRIFNKAEENFLQDLPDMYIQLVMNDNRQGRLVHSGIYAGNDQNTYQKAAEQSYQENIHLFDKPVKKIVCYMRPDEFRSLWVANKAVFKTRMAVAEGGELIIIAPGAERFGEQKEADDLIRKYGYCGRENILEAYRENSDLQNMEHAAAHLMHSSSEGRFKITYASEKLTKEEIEQVHYNHIPLNEALKIYHPEKLQYGWNSLKGEDIYFIPNPALGLWAVKDKIENRN